MPDAQELDAPSKKALIALARLAIAHAVQDRSRIGEKAIERIETAQPRLAQPMGAFVTLYAPAGTLRGCLGELAPHDSLARVVARCAGNAAYADYRFEAIQPTELPAVTFKISVLSPPTPLPSPEAIEIGRHGLIVRYDDRLGVLLPEVPVEHGWDRTTFLQQLWRKAGIPADVTVDEVELRCFSSTVLDGEMEAL